MPISNWVYFILTAQLLWALTSLIDKIVISKGHIRNPLVFIVFNGLMNILAIFVLPLVDFEPLSMSDFLIAMISGVFFVAGIVFYYKAVKHDEISRIIILFQFLPVFVLLLSFLFLGQMLGKNELIGFLFLVSAGVIVSYKKANRAFRLSKAFYFMAVGAFLIAIGYVTQEYVFSITNFWNAFFWLRVSMFSALCVLLIPSIRRDFINTMEKMPNKIRALVGFKMFTDFSAFLFLGFALLNGPVALISALGNSIEPLFIFTITLVTSLYLPNIIKEDIDKKSIMTKLLALALIIIGVVFVNFKVF